MTDPELRAILNGTRLHDSAKREVIGTIGSLRDQNDRLVAANHALVEACGAALDEVKRETKAKLEQAIELATRHECVTVCSQAGRPD
ncbi:MAG: hypothetical protein ACC628_17175 [Pirellulaceae bacterium]